MTARNNSGARLAALLLAASLPVWGADDRKLTVTATAYNSVPAQTDATPHVGAWGDRLDRLEPGVRAIAVSADLVKKGLHRGKRVRIKGLKGEFVVLDRMPRRWHNRIDIHMGKDVRAARRWGRRFVEVRWSD